MQIKTLSIALLFLSTLFLSSFLYHKEKNLMEQQSMNTPANYHQEFKTVFFCQCLRKGYQNNHSIKETLMQDNSQASDFPLGIYNYQLIDTLAQEVNEKILQDSIQIAKFFCNGECEDKEEFERKRASGKIGRRIIQHCLDYYESEELDSIARSKYKD